MKVLLINPPFQKLKGIDESYYPLSLGYLAAILRSVGIDTKIYDAEHFPIKGRVKYFFQNRLNRQEIYQNALQDEKYPIWIEVENVLFSEKPDIVGITVMSPKFPSASKISEIIRKKFPFTKIVWGGYHPTSSAQEIMETGLVDFVVRGEGENTLKELCLALKNRTNQYQAIKGLSYIKDNNIVHNMKQTLISDIDKLPDPDRENLLFPERFSKGQLNALLSSRGCPFDCSYCDSKNVWDKQVRYRKIELVLEEIIKIKERFNIKYFFFWDDSFTLKRKRIVQFCEIIIKNKLNFNWGCTTRVDLIDKMLLKTMKKAGCCRIDIGIESGSEKILDYINKGITLKKIYRATELLNKSGIFWTSFFMIGFPYETKEDINQTYQLMKHIKTPRITLSTLTPYPGSKIYNDLVSVGLISKKTDWTKLSHQSTHNDFIMGMDKRKFENISMQMYEFVDRQNMNWKAFRHFLFLKFTN